MISMILITQELQPDMYGINNRNLGSFVTDVENSWMAELCL